MLACRCHTNLDEFKAQAWPIVVRDNVAVGESVLSATGVRLKVVSISNEQWFPAMDRGPQPLLVLELGKE